MEPYWVTDLHQTKGEMKSACQRVLSIPSVHFPSHQINYNRTGVSGIK